MPTCSGILRKDLYRSVYVPPVIYSCVVFGVHTALYCCTFSLEASLQLGPGQMAQAKNQPHCFPFFHSSLFCTSQLSIIGDCRRRKLAIGKQHRKFLVSCLPHNSQTCPHFIPCVPSCSVRDLQKNNYVYFHSFGCGCRENNFKIYSTSAKGFASLCMCFVRMLGEYWERKE